MEQPADSTKPQVKAAITITEAVSSFRADEDGRCLEKTTIAQSRTLFEVLLLNWAKQRGLILLTELTTPELTTPELTTPELTTPELTTPELTTPELTKFRASWGNGPNTTRRKHERLVGFFNFCIANDWTEKNPAARMKRVEESAYRQTISPGKSLNALWTRLMPTAIGRADTTSIRARSAFWL